MVNIKAYLWKYVLDRREIEFLCSPKLEGVFTTLLGGILLVVFMTSAIISDRLSLGLTLTFLGISIALTIYGIYYWRLRTKPIKRTISPGSLAFRLYHRNLLAYTAYSIFNTLVVFLIISSILTALDGEFSADRIRSHMASGLRLSVLVLLECLRSALLIYQYDHSPKETHRYADGQSEILSDNSIANGK